MDFQDKMLAESMMAGAALIIFGVLPWLVGIVTILRWIF